MNSNIQRLWTIANKDKRCIIGLMSGTSVDGLDIALCHFSGTGNNTHIELSRFETVPYSKDYKDEISSVFSKKKSGSRKTLFVEPMGGPTTCSYDPYMLKEMEHRCGQC